MNGKYLLTIVNNSIEESDNGFYKANLIRVYVLYSYFLYINHMLCINTYIYIYIYIYTHIMYIGAFNACMQTARMQDQCPVLTKIISMHYLYIHIIYIYSIHKYVRVLRLTRI